MESPVEEGALTLLERITEALLDPACYPRGADRVESVETHMSRLFFTERHVYKLKKPVKYPFLDFSTPQARHLDCREEVRLNRRLAADVYFGAVPLKLRSDNRIGIAGEGEGIDWLVEMRRLPRGLMLDEMIRERRLRERHIVMLADRMVPFYRYAEPAGLTPVAYLADLRRDIVTDCAELIKFLPERRLQLARIQESLLTYLETAAPILGERVRRGRIVEGHGDLRPEHICLEEPPAVFDCLEFNRRFRLVDPVDELGFAGLECEYLDRPGVGRRLLHHYREATGDQFDRRIVTFYKATRALMRARLALRHLPELPPDAWERWQTQADRYLALAAHHADRLQAPLRRHR